jgi:hypothetical protein
MKNTFENLKIEVNKGIIGENNGISTGFEGFDRYISVKRKIYTLIFGSSGTGKSTFAHNAYILNPFDWWWKNKDTTKIKLKIVYFSMERSAAYITAKWLVRKIFLNEKILIPLPKLMGWWKTKLTKDEHDLFLQYEPYFHNMENVVEIIEGVQNPTGIYKWIKNWGEKNGKIEQISEFNKVYIPDDENLITVIVVDHQSLIKKEKGILTKKEAIDKLSEYLQHARDFYGFSPVLVAQMNRDIANPMYQKMETFEPTPEQIKDSATSFEDSDICMSLFDPIKFKTKAPTFHDAEKLIDLSTGAKFYRSLKIHKNSWGEDDIRKGLAFHGAIGHFAELPKYNEMTEEDYKSVINGTYFLKQKLTPLKELKL